MTEELNTGYKVISLAIVNVLLIEVADFLQSSLIEVLASNAKVACVFDFKKGKF